MGVFKTFARQIKTVKSMYVSGCTVPYFLGLQGGGGPWGELHKT